MSGAGRSGRWWQALLAFWAYYLATFEKVVVEDGSHSGV